MLKEKTLFGIVDKVQIAIQRLREFEPEEGYYLAFSGGKDSITIKRLADMSGVKYDAHYSVTTIDPPELVYFIREEYPDVIWERPEKHLLTALLHHGFPSRQSRWCCNYYKENGGKNRRIITGVRSEESITRRHRPIFHHCYNGGYKNKNKTILNVIIDWTEKDVWDFIKQQKLKYCCLYDEGYTRIGCIMCPLSTAKNRKRDAERYPQYVRAYIKAFKRLYDKRKKEGKKAIDRWKDGEEMFWWWLRENRESEDTKQVMLFE